MPLVFLTIALVAKVGAILIEIGDPAAVGDDFGLVIPLAAMWVLATIVMRRTAGL